MNAVRTHAPRPRSLATLMQPAPIVQPYDSVGRALRIMSDLRLSALPVVDDRGNLVGQVCADRLRARLMHGDAQAGLHEPLGHYVQQPLSVVSIDATAQDVQRTLASTGSDAAYVVDRGGYLAGMVRWHDLVVPHEQVRAPLGAGGMATPFGIYLTAGGVRAGVSSRGLALGGAALGLLIAAAHLLVGLGCWGLDAAAGTRVLDLWFSAAPPSGLGPSSVWLALQGASAVVFLLLLRMSPITGYHGAEHQVVHAMERGDPLTPEVVARMPRVHMRCGTNLIAGIAVFAGLLQTITVLRPFGMDALLGSLIGAAVAARTWRSVGAFLQQHFTTRQPSPKQLERAIETANELRERYPHEARARLSLLHRIWTMGAPQTALGVFVGTGVPLVALELLLGRLQ